MSSVSSLNSLLSSATNSSTSSSVDLSSLLQAATGSSSTGIDVTSAVAAAIYADQAPERQWQAQQATIKSQISAMTSLQTSLSSVSSDLDDLNSLSGSLASVTATSSSADVTASASAGASVGSHVVTVNSLATTASWYSPAVSTATASLSAMQLQIVGQNGTTSTFTTGNGVDTLSQLASTINSSSAGVTASVVSDATGSRLALVGNSSGSANDFSVSYGTVSGASWASSPAASSTTALSAGSFTIGDGSQTTNFSVTEGETLSDVAGQINNAGLDVSASVVTDSNGAHLSLSSTTGTVTVSGDPAFAMQRASTGSNASLTVDGIPVSSATNQVTGAVNDVTFNLLGKTSGQATVTVSADQSQIATALSQFVTDYNSALSGVNSQFTYSSTSSSQGVLSGDPTIRSLQSSLENVVGYSTTAAGSTTPVTLSSLGITMGDDGTLSLDTTKLSAAIGSNPSAVQNFFQGTALNGFAQSFQTALATYTDPSSGALTVGINNLNQSYTDLQSQVDDYESGYIASQQTVLTAMYSQAEIALQSLPTTLKQLQSELGENSGS